MAELRFPALRAPRRNRTGIPSLEGWHTSHCVSEARRVPQVSNLPAPGFSRLLLNRRPYTLRACALPAAPQLVTSGSPESNRVSPESESGRLPSSSIPKAWTTADSNRVPPACEAGALPDELAAHGRHGTAATARSAGMATCRYGAHAMDVSISKHIHPRVVLRRNGRS